MNPVSVRSQAPLGPIYSFVPAGDAQRAQELTSELVNAMRVYLPSEAGVRNVLLADFLDDPEAHVEPQPLTITCADLRCAAAGAAAFTARLSEAIFVVSTTDEYSLREARQATEWLRSLKREACSGLVLLPVPGGVTATRAEQITGLPVCSVVRERADLTQLAGWISQD